MNTNTVAPPYKINNVTVTSNGRNTLYFDVEWEGDDDLDYYELRIWESDKDNCLELDAYISHKQRIPVRDFCFIKGWESRKVNKETVYVELGIAEYDDDGKLKSWKALAAYDPIEIDIYYEFHFFRKNVLEIRKISKKSA